MAAGGGAFGLPGELPESELPAALGWPPELVRDLIDRGLIRRVGASWAVDAAHELVDRWADAQWQGGDDDEEQR